ncbi:serine hydrolase domain-containing protein [Anaerosporobacter sp.]|uniref:serine hydrolase domain-containing protein n=1 Tax=Anaerosporobacter sp. TaxID=1872529 RepID=UPI00286F8DC6|nr:serine hydrolase [Anaerosporobacter sp.]
MNQEFINNIDNYIMEHRYRLINSILVYENGEIVFERYYNKFNESSRNNIKSIWKSILSVCVGICLDKGYIKSLDEPIMNYLPEFSYNIHPYHKKILIRHLLTMTSGIYWNSGAHYHCPMFEQLIRSKNWCEHISDINMAHLPGSKYVYKEWDVALLSAIIGKATGMTSYEFCNKYLYQPLEIASGEWSKSRCGVCYNVMNGEIGSDLSARDIAKIGFLFYQKGFWNNERIISEKYIEMALTPSPQNAGYGFLWWLSDKGYGGRGFGGQELNVYTEQNIIAVIQATATPSSKSYGDICAGIIGYNL